MGLKKHDFEIALNVHPKHQTADTKVSMRLGQFTPEEKDKVAEFERAALHTIANHTEWLTERPTVKSMAEAIRNTEFGKLRGKASDTGQYVVVSYQPKLAGESMSTPHLRIPPLRNSMQQPGGQHYKKMIQAVIQSRDPADSEEVGSLLHEGDCFVIGDAGRHGNAAAIMSAFTRDDGTHLTRQTKTLFCFYKEEEHAYVICLSIIYCPFSPSCRHVHCFQAGACDSFPFRFAVYVALCSVHSASATCSGSETVGDARSWGLRRCVSTPLFRAATGGQQETCVFLLPTWQGCDGPAGGCAREHVHGTDRTVPLCDRQPLVDHQAPPVPQCADLHCGNLHRPDASARLEENGGDMVLLVQGQKGHVWRCPDLAQR